MVEPAHEHVEPAHTHVDAAPVASSRSWGWTGLAVRIVLTLAGAAAMIVSSFLDWVRGQGASDISVRALWSQRFGHEGSWLTTVGAVLVALGVIAIIGLAPRTGWLTSLAGALGIGVFALLLVQVYRAELTVSDLDPGAWVGVIGAVVALIGGFFGPRTTVVSPGPATTVP
jgi:hypothetical protein